MKKTIYVTLMALAIILTLSVTADSAYANNPEHVARGPLKESIQEVEYTFNDIFPDENLALGIAEAFNRQPTDGVTIEELNNFGLGLQLNGLGIENLEGIQHLTPLQNLLLDNNEISDLEPLSGLINLEFLGLDDNNIIEIGSLQDLINLEELSLVNNNINNVEPLSGLLNLEFLGLVLNNVTDLQPLSSLINLKLLDLDQNNIIDLSPLSGLINLEVLGLDLNNVTDLQPLSSLINLNVLSLAANDIIDLSPLSGLNDLTWLNLGENNITDLSQLSDLINLDTLILMFNNINDLSPLSGLINLGWLDLTQNNIIDLSPLSGLINLNTLGLGSNNINDVSPLEGLTNFVELQLDNNNIRKVDSLGRMFNLEYLDLDGNKITDLVGLGGLHAEIWALDQSLEIPSIPFGNFTNGIYIRGLDGHTPNLSFKPEGGSYDPEIGKITWSSVGENTLSWDEPNFSGTISQYATSPSSLGIQYRFRTGLHCERDPWDPDIILGCFTTYLADIVGFNGAQNNLIIPSFVSHQGNRYLVGRIESNAFADKGLRRVEFQSNHFNIGHSAFAGNPLESIVVPKTTNFFLSQLRSGMQGVATETILFEETTPVYKWNGYDWASEIDDHYGD